MSIGSENDLIGLKRAGNVAREALDAMKRVVQPGMTTGELDEVAKVVFQKQGVPLLLTAA